jgi:hypothetical protein
MKLKWSDDEGLIRSVGDPPNGILTLDAQNEDGVTWLVDPDWQPKGVGPNEKRFTGKLSGPSERCVPISARDAVAACEDRIDGFQLLRITVEGIIRLQGFVIPTGQWEVARSAIDLVEAVNAALYERWPKGVG